MLPDMAETLEEWQAPYPLKTVTRQTVDFVEDDVVTSREIQAAIQPAQKARLTAADIDWSLRYLQIHSPDEIAMGEFLEFQGEDYKIIDNGDFQLYGFTDAVGEQTKRPLLVVTP